MRTYRERSQELHRFSAGLPLLLLVPSLLLALCAWQWRAAEQVLGLALILFVAAPVAALITYWRRLVGAVVTLLGLVVLIVGGGVWFETSSPLALLPIPVLLAALALGVPAALATAAGATVGLATVTLAPTPLIMMDSLYAITLVAAMWGSAALCWAIYRPIHELAEWSWDHYAQAQSLLEEARDRQVELKETLEALAHANRELALMNERLAKLRAVAENAQKAKAAFVSSVSHEFRTPLNIIIGLAELLLDTGRMFGESLGARTYEAITVLHRNCEHLASMIDDVLDLSQVEAGRLAVQRRYTDLAALVRGALGVVTPLLDRKGLTLTVDVPLDLPDVYCDATRIRQVILNLVSNATRFTERGGIHVSAYAQENHVVVSVRDTGPGISPEDAGRIFQPFQQAGVRLTGAETGHGLGLAISKQFVELHQGRMWLESHPGQGSTFAFRLPISPLTDPTAPPERWITEGWVTRTARAPVPQPRLQDRMILCDEAGELLPLLARYADQTEFVATPTCADAARTLDETPAQAILLNAPHLEGLLGAVEEMRQMAPDTPIIGCSLPRKATHALRAGAVGYLLKPVHQADLMRILDSLPGAAERVLIVDDEEDTLWFLEQLVSVCCEGAEILTAQSGAEALRLMATSRPDLVLLDIVMPDMDGWQILEQKAADPALADVPVAIVSAQDPYETPSTEEATSAEQVSSTVLVITMGDGLSIGTLLRCTQAVSSLLLQPN